MFTVVKPIPYIKSINERHIAVKRKCWSYIDTLVSGSPILQDGKIVGVVTYVLVNDPTRGYGIFIEDITCTNPYERGGKYGMTMCMSMTKDLGMKTEDIFKAVTSTPARILEKDEEWGYLKVGRIADIAVFDYADEGYDLTDRAGNRIKSDKGYRCMLTISDGQIIYKL